MELQYHRSLREICRTQSKKTEVCKKQTSVVVLLEFGDQRLQHIHHLALPVRGKRLQTLGELRGSEHRRRVQTVLKKLVCPNIEHVGNGNQLFQLWRFHASLYDAHMVHAVIHSGSKIFLRHADSLTSGLDPFTQCDLIHTQSPFERYPFLNYMGDSVCFTGAHGAITVP